MENKFTIVVVVEHDQNGIKPVTNEILNAASNLGGFVIAYYFSENRSSIFRRRSTAVSDSSTITSSHRTIEPLSFQITIFV